MDILQKAMRVYRLLNILSIDVALGAVCSSIFFAHILCADITIYSLISLGLSVWIIYTADHLLDAKKINTSATTNRHRFHQQHFQLLLVLVIVAACMNAVLLLFIRRPALITGIILVALVILYLLIQHSLKFLKEIFVALVYTTGVMLPAMSNTQISWKDWNWMVIVQFALIAFLNLIIFSWFDYENDVQDKRISFVTIFGKKTSQIFIYLLFILSMALWVVTFSPQVETAIFFGMNAALFIMVYFHSYFATQDRYRILGDAIFFSPLFVWLL
jgi:4-hydroxybenzoate polyprenyltransferase